MKILLITPPMVQINTPYSAVPVLAGFLKAQGAEVKQADFSLEVALSLFSKEGVDLAVRAAKSTRNPDGAALFLLEHEQEYRTFIGPVVSFLQGKAPEYAWRFGRRGVLPEGPHFLQLDDGLEEDEYSDLQEEFGYFGVQDKAKLLASLFIDDLSQIYQETLDPDFSLARYAEHLAVAAPVFDPIPERLAQKPSPVDRLIDSLTDSWMKLIGPDTVGLTIPFPGTVYGAFRIAAYIRKHFPSTRIVMGGGYVNSELQDLSDRRVFDYVDDLCFGEGFTPWLGILGKAPLERVRTREKWYPNVPPPSHRYEVPVSDYTDVPFDRYLSLVESANPMHRLWSDGHWLKVQLANGCYWHKCAFCDVALDYIGRYAPADAKQAVDALLQMRDATGISAFHFTDEALPPGLIRALCNELLVRGEQLVWWGNIRLDLGLTAELCQLMARAGCIGVSAGLECANDRLLKLMNKGITCSSARTVCEHLTDAGLLVHVYLMYGFPTETEKETHGALDFVRKLFRDGLVQSAFWHRFALTVHSPIAKNPEKFGIIPEQPDTQHPRFALNELNYSEPGAPDHAKFGPALSLAVYNYMQGKGLDLPVSFWFQQSL